MGKAPTRDVARVCLSTVCVQVLYPTGALRTEYVETCGGDPDPEAWSQINHECRISRDGFSILTNLMTVETTSDITGVDDADLPTYLGDVRLFSSFPSVCSFSRPSRARVAGGHVSACCGGRRGTRPEVARQHPRPVHRRRQLV